jgi:hypothetical protein
MKGAFPFGTSPMKKYVDADIDPYSTAIVEDLLGVAMLFLPFREVNGETFLTL